MYRAYHDDAISARYGGRCGGKHMSDVVKEEKSWKDSNIVSTTGRLHWQSIWLDCRIESQRSQFWLRKFMSKKFDCCGHDGQRADYLFA